MKAVGEGVTGLPGLTGGLRPGLNPWARPAHRGAQHHLPRGPVPAPDSASAPGAWWGRAAQPEAAPRPHSEAREELGSGWRARGGEDRVLTGENPPGSR